MFLLSDQVAHMVWLLWLLFFLGGGGEGQPFDVQGNKLQKEFSHFLLRTFFCISSGKINWLICMLSIPCDRGLWFYSELTIDVIELLELNTISL